jgi:hypothetical protein
MFVVDIHISIAGERGELGDDFHFGVETILRSGTLKMNEFRLHAVSHYSAILSVIVMYWMVVRRVSDEEEMKGRDRLLAWN